MESLLAFAADNARAEFAPAVPAPRTPDLLGWNAILDHVERDASGHPTRVRDVIRPYLYDLLRADVEFDYEVTTSKEFGDAVNAFAEGASVDWNAIIPELLLRHATKIVSSGLEQR